ncbi:MAG: discoidin domain-containing protein [Candidatus Omnitrophica bacterium]|nr:discoidin domain-containing protein [Candidatus Omnitrophota bacterium]
MMMVLAGLLLPQAAEAHWASSSESGQEAALAFDGDTSTRWRAGVGTYPQILRMDLGNSQSISGIKTTFPNNRAYLYEIFVSDEPQPGENLEAAEWRCVVESKVGDNESKDTFAPVQARHVATRFNSLTPNGGVELDNPYGDPQGWTLTVESELSDQAHTGKRALFAKEGYSFTNYTLDLFEVAGKVYTFSCYGKSDAKAAGYAVLICQDLEGNQVVLDAPFGVFTGKYRRFVSRVRIPRSIDSIARVNLYRMSVSMNGKEPEEAAGIWYDDLTLVEGPIGSDLPMVIEQSVE